MTGTVLGAGDIAVTRPSASSVQASPQCSGEDGDKQVYKCTHEVISDNDAWWEDDKSGHCMNGEGQLL